MKLRAALCVLVVLALTGVAWWTRWDVQVANKEGPTTGFMVDRLTGKVYWLRNNEAFPVEPGR